MSEDSFAGIKAKSDSEYFTDFTITDCNFTDYFQGIYLQGVDGARIENNVIKNTKHNAIALQSSVNNSAKGEVVIVENYIANAQDRAIRLNNTEPTLKLSANNNIILNSGDEDGQMFKATTIANNAVINLENNYWGGKDAATAVANTDVVPDTTGILSGVFIEEVRSEYCANGRTAVSWKTTEEGIPVKVYLVDEEDVIADTISAMVTSGTIKSGDEIEVIKGNLTVKIDTVGVTVKNSSDGTVAVNGKAVPKDSSTTTADPAKPVVPETKPETKPEIKPDGSPDTGDTTTMLPWIALLALTAVAGAGVFITRRNHN